MSKKEEAVERENAELKKRIEDMERKLERALTAMSRPETRGGGRNVVDTTYEEGGAIVAVDLKKVFHAMSPRQHAAMQMLLANASNAQIAERLGVTENGAKTYITLLYRKLGIVNSGPHNKRLWVKDLIEPYFEKISDAEYLSLAGIPKNWHRDFSKIGKRYTSVIGD